MIFVAYSPTLSLSCFVIVLCWASREVVGYAADRGRLSSQLIVFALSIGRTVEFIGFERRASKSRDTLYQQMYIVTTARPYV